MVQIPNTEIRVLIVDDDQDICDSLSRELHRRGFSCETAMDGGQGLKRLVASKPAVVLVDLEMSGLNGFDILAIMKGTGIRTVPIMLTGKGNIDVALESMKLGAFDFLEKPCAPNVLEQAIKRAVEHYQRQTSPLESAGSDSGLWETLFNAARDTLVILDKQFQILHCNFAAARLVEAEPEQLVGKDIHDALCREAHNRADCPYLPQPGIDDSEARECVLSEKYYEVSLTALEMVANTSPWAWMVVSHDITLRRQAELALLESERQFLDILYAADDAIFLLDGDHFVDCNDCAVRMLGYSSREDLLQRHPWEISPPVQPDGSESSTKAIEILRTGQHHFEWMHRKANGEDFPVEVALIPISHRGMGMIYCLWKDLTEKKRADEALRNSHERMHAIMSSIPAGILVVDEELHCIVDANPSAVDMIGLPLEEILGRGCTDFICSIKPGRCPVRDSPHMAGEIEDDFLTAMGKRIPVLKTIVRAEIDGRNCLVHCLMDISGPKKVEEELRVLLDQQRAIFETSMVGIMVLRDRVIVAVNQRMANMLGYTQEELEGHNTEPLHVSHENYVEFGKKYYETLANQQTVIQTEYTLKHKDGHIVWGMFSGKAIDPSDLNHGVVWVVDDVTDRKRAEEALGEKEEKYRQIVEHVKMGVSLISQDMRVLELNQQMRDWFPGINVEEHPLCHQAFYNKAAPCESCPTRETFKDGLFHELFFDLQRDGVNRLYRLATSPIHGADNQVVTVIEMVEDVTEQRAMEGRLLQAQKLESIGQLAAGIAHEINTPTQFIGDNTHFLRDTFADLFALIEEYEMLLKAAKKGNITPELIKELEEIIEQIDFEFLKKEIPTAIERSMAGIERVTKIVRAMKDFSHPAGSERTLLDINKAIESTITVARNEWKYVSELETDYDLSLPLVPCFPGPFNQVILNMVVNSAHAVDEKARTQGRGKGLIKVSTKQRDRYVEIRIADTGAGIPKEIQSRIYDPFFTTKGVGKGTGQGLAIAHSVIVEQHKGTIELESEVGVGTTFVLRLPLDNKSSESEATQEGVGKTENVLRWTH
jgi:two-component system, NtrC family, sensor kinase